MNRVAKFLSTCFAGLTFLAAPILLLAQTEWPEKVHDEIVTAFETETHVRVLIWAIPKVSAGEFSTMALSFAVQSETTPRTFDDYKMVAAELDESEMLSIANDSKVLLIEPDYRGEIIADLDTHDLAR